MSPEEAQKVVDEVFSLYDKYGAADYIGEPVSQMEHMSQAADLAIEDGADPEVILAAFFHDIGHISDSPEAGSSMDGFGTRNHEMIGASYLRSKGFPERIAKLVESHVDAKRYLTCRERGYYASLSVASRKTLEFQGGIMSEAEADRFETDPDFKEKVQLRKWDELAKRSHIPITDLSVLRGMAFRVLISQQSQTIPETT